MKPALKNKQGGKGKTKPSDTLDGLAKGELYEPETLAPLDPQSYTDLQIAIRGSEDSSRGILGGDIPIMAGAIPEKDNILSAKLVEAAESEPWFDHVPESMRPLLDQKGVRSLLSIVYNGALMSMQSTSKSMQDTFLQQLKEMKEAQAKQAQEATKAAEKSQKATVDLMTSIQSLQLANIKEGLDTLRKDFNGISRIAVAEPMSIPFPCGSDEEWTLFLATWKGTNTASFDSRLTNIRDKTIRKKIIKLAVNGDADKFAEKLASFGRAGND